MATLNQNFHRYFEQYFHSFVSHFLPLLQQPRAAWVTQTETDFGQTCPEGWVGPEGGHARIWANRILPK